MLLKLWQRIKSSITKQPKSDQDNSYRIEAQSPNSENISRHPGPPAKISQQAKNKVAIAAFNQHQQDLFGRLKSLRMEFASKNEQSAFMVFSDATLLDMIDKMPKTEAGMLNVKGVGKEKLVLYGAAFLDLINNSKFELTPSQQILFEGLKSLRLEHARKNGKYAFQVFSDKTLLDMITKMPATKVEMLDVKGVGKVKFEQYGKDFLEVIASRANDNDIELDYLDVLANIDHFDYLTRSIENSQKRLVIMSGWIASNVVDDEFLILIEKKLAQRLEIYIGYGYQDNRGKHKGLKGTKEALASLHNLEKKYPSQLFIASFATHEKLLLVDSHCVVIGSANWLCNKNYINSERSLIVENSVFVNSEATRAIKLIKQNRLA